MMELKLADGSVTLIDEESYEVVKDYKWTRNKTTNYVQATKYLGKIDGRYKQQTIYLHVLIKGSPRGKQVDHRDGNKLNNTLLNLRVCTRTENNRNKATVQGKNCKYKGVTLRDTLKYPKRPYRARITYDGKKHLLGDYRTEKEAAEAYNQAALTYFGEFAKLNDL